MSDSVDRVKMAAFDFEPSNDKTLKGNKIHVNVEEALDDLFVVSYSYGNKLYQGVLLDSTKM